MSTIKKSIHTVQDQFDQAYQNIKTLQDVESCRIDFLGKKGKITGLLPELKNLSQEEKKELGPIIQALKQTVEEKLEQCKNDIITHEAQQEIFKAQQFDVTITEPQVLRGSVHPYSQFVEEIEDIFLSMGYETVDGPELESDDNNFTALNIPQDHPARDMYDTFWMNIPGLLLRTHTSPVQVRTMKQKELPMAIIAPGRCFRHEATDASHDFMFMQCEGLYIDKNVTLSHLFATAQTFLKALFKKESLDIRIRPGFFPFVEPGIEIDARCPFCKNGCSVCKKSTWIEVFPCGLIHPSVLRNCGIDPERYSGFAFGFGLTRLAMLKYGIDDIRLFYGGNTRFLKQF